VTGASPQYAERTTKFRESLEAYARRWNFLFRFYDFPEEGFDSSWCKLDAVLDALVRHQSRVLWVDADCQVINPDIDIRRWLSPPMTFSQDSNGLCAGIFSVVGDDGQTFLRVVQELGRLRDHVPYKAEQTTIKWLLSWCTRWNYDLIPVDVISNPECTQDIRDRAWAHHYWFSA